MMNAQKKIDAMIPRHKTPPYMNAESEVVHRRLTPGAILIMSTDGMMDFYEEMDRGEPRWVCQNWMDMLEQKDNAELDGLGDSKALVLLKDALGENLEKQSLLMTIDGGDAPMMDDTTVLVLNL
jgi:pyruvate dehydrogenase phosphatase